jgi:hypothetical protein
VVPGGQLPQLPPAPGTGAGQVPQGEAVVPQLPLERSHVTGQHTREPAPSPKRPPLSMPQARPLPQSVFELQGCRAAQRAVHAPPQPLSPHVLPSQLAGQVGRQKPHRAEVEPHS